MSNIEEAVPYKPVKTRVYNRQAVMPKVEILSTPMHHNSLPQEVNNLCGHMLKKGSYDIDYVIVILKVILQQKPHFGLQESIRKLLAMLEVERDQINLKKTIES
jgi:hypothetical protein